MAGVVDGSSVPPLPKPSHRRARRFITAGVVLLVFVAVFFVTTTAPMGDSATAADGPEVAWTAAVAALAGVGSLALGVAEFVRDSVRYRRERRSASADRQDDRGYL
jgi:hypothetical protein